MGLDKFRTPDAVIFELEGEEFSILLPTKWNRAYTRAWQNIVTEGMTVDKGEVNFTNMKASELLDAQRSAFVEHCVLSGPITGAALLDDYRPLLEILFDAATAKANEEEDAFEKTVGKWKPISAGQLNGKASLTSTKSSLIQEGSQLPT